MLLHLLPHPNFPNTIAQRRAPTALFQRNQGSCWGIFKGSFWNCRYPTLYRHLHRSCLEDPRRPEIRGPNSCEDLPHTPANSFFLVLPYSTTFPQFGYQGGFGGCCTDRSNQSKTWPVSGRGSLSVEKTTRLDQSEVGEGHWRPP